MKTVLFESKLKINWIEPVSCCYNKCNIMCNMCIMHAWETYATDAFGFNILYIFRQLHITDLSQ